MKMWTESPILNNTDVELALEIIDDALCYGFEFKVENGKIFYKEP